MPLQRTETYTAPATTGSWNLDPSITPFNASVAVVLSGTASYKLQYSYDTLDSPTALDSDATWFDSGDIPAATTTSSQAGFITPIARIRLVIASVTGSLKMTLLQGIGSN